VNGNAETIYFPRDDKDSTLIGLNKTQSSFVVMYIKNKKIQKVVFTTASNGTMYPLGELKGKDLYLKNFFWLEDQRPKGKQDLFLVFPKFVKPKNVGSDMNDTKPNINSPGKDKNFDSKNGSPANPGSNQKNNKTDRRGNNNTAN
jgi:hypothetical protein